MVSLCSKTSGCAQIHPRQRKKAHRSCLDELSLAAALHPSVPIGVIVSLCCRSLNDSDSWWMNGMGKRWGRWAMGKGNLGALGIMG